MNPIFPRYSLKTLLVLISLLCLLLAPISVFGINYGITLMFSLLVLLATWSLLVKLGAKQGIIGAACILVAAFFVAILSIPFFLHAASNFLGSLICGWFKAGKKATFIVLLVSLVIPFSLFMSYGIRDLREYDRLRAENPLESLKGRLTPLQNGIAIPRTAEFSETVDVALIKMEEDTKPHFFSRTNYLKRLHGNSYRKFVAAQGFGPARMQHRFSPRSYYFPPLNKADLPLAVRNEIVEEPQHLHDQAMSEVINIDRMGYLKSQEEVAGFEGHAFSTLPNEISGDHNSAVWNLTQLQLVSLLRHEVPVVYLTESLPQMEDINEYPHRSLNEFEEKSLSHLVSEQDVVIDESDDKILMLGAVRAGKTCLDCHNGQRGDLLGAFTYKLELTSN